MSCTEPTLQRLAYGKTMLNTSPMLAWSALIVVGLVVNSWYLWRLHRLMPTHLNKNKPFRIYLLRHGESEGNLDQHLFQFVPDHAIPLTSEGRRQAETAGTSLKEMIGDGHVRFWVSPYQRTRQTFKIASRAFDPNRVTMREEPRLREQDWGNFQDYEIVEECRRLRKRFGAFFYRIPAGESGADVFDRVSNFLESLFRDFNSNPTKSVVLISHGLTCRLFLMRFLHWPFEKFEKTRNLKNCEILVLERQANGRYQLITPLEDDKHPVVDEWDEFMRQKHHLLSPRTPISLSSESMEGKHRRLMSELI